MGHDTPARQVRGLTRARRSNWSGLLAGLAGAAVLAAAQPVSAADAKTPPPADRAPQQLAQLGGSLLGPPGAPPPPTVAPAEPGTAPPPAETPPLSVTVSKPAPAPGAPAAPPPSGEAAPAAEAKPEGAPPPGAEGEAAKAAEETTPSAPDLSPFALGAPPATPEPEAPLAQPGSFLSYIFPLGERSDEPVLRATPWPLLGVGVLPVRPEPLLELGNGFLQTGPLSQGVELPGGAIWQPRLWVFGTYRSAVQAFDNGNGKHVAEWANRLDIFANLQLTGTERLVVGLRPLDRDRSGEFTGWQFDPRRGEGGKGFFNANVRTLFFEGDLGSTLPILDRRGVLPIDFGYTIGRQPLLYQEGILINDNVDMVGITRNSIHVPFSSNMQVSAFYADRHVERANRPDFVPGGRPKLYGLATTVEILDTSYEFDLLRVTDPAFGDTWYGGASAIKRIGLVNTALRFNGSLPDGAQNVVSTKGLLVTLETSFTPYFSEDIVYFNPYFSVGNFTQAAKDPIVGGPLASLGITYAAYGIGTAISPLSGAAQDAAGFALGYQAFWDHQRRSLTLELGVREETHNRTFNAQALGARFQQALGQRILFEVDTTVTRQENRGTAYGLRAEFMYQF